MSFEVWAPIVSTVISGIFLVAVARINKDNKPLKNALKKGKAHGDGSLIEALGILQREYRESQVRHAAEIQYFVDQIKAVRLELDEVRDALDKKEGIITDLQEKLEHYKNRLDPNGVEI